jgi:hypothetical protein
MPQSRAPAASVMCYTVGMIRANLLDRFLDPFGAFLTPEVARRLVDFRVDEQTQARIDELADKCNEGQLTPAEREEYDTYISVIDFITVLQAKARTVVEQSMAN